ncbi:hypothetical protein D9757_007760 [Collybiopsis confluens]|uniref:Glucose-methanol-choline oxidoreductase C-terminal domain-containing protein n=1 Tax=Collybiopsis confluens TaxID=2823264 RepID=A0A8H5MAL3_9AGAR|nr:hypothetical protein D9757_011258 [Collybiopsis confluens]KAF5387455.1 hypothetical protein D9757_007760 [Collybiopsis confluens]
MEEELKEMGPEFNALWDTYFKDKPDKPMMFGSIVSGAYADHTLLPPEKYITIFLPQEYPASRGKIHIKSSSPYVLPSFDSGFMNHKADFAPIRWSYKKTREVARRMDAFRGELTSHHPHFHPASPAACKDIDITAATRSVTVRKPIACGFQNKTRSLVTFLLRDSDMAQRESSSKPQKTTRSSMKLCDNSEHSFEIDSLAYSIIINHLDEVEVILDETSIMDGQQPGVQDTLDSDYFQSFYSDGVDATASTTTRNDNPDNVSSKSDSDVPAPAPTQTRFKPYDRNTTSNASQSAARDPMANKVITPSGDKRVIIRGKNHHRIEIILRKVCRHFNLNATEMKLQRRFHVADEEWVCDCSNDATLAIETTTEGSELRLCTK